MKKLFLVVLLIFGIAGFAQATPITKVDNWQSPPDLAGSKLIDFNDLTSGWYTSLAVDNVTISNSAGESFRVANDATPNGIYVPPTETDGQYLLDPEQDGNFLFDFTDNVSAFYIQVGATNEAQLISAYDDDGNFLESVDIPVLYDEAHPNVAHTGFFGISDYSNISYFVLSADNDPFGLVLDDLRYVTATNGPSPVPEPATMVLFGVGLAGLAGLKRSKQK